jgi:hypothetical protein
MSEFNAVSEPNHLPVSNRPISEHCHPERAVEGPCLADPKLTH